MNSADISSKGIVKFPFHSLLLCGSCFKIKVIITFVEDSSLSSIGYMNSDLHSHEHITEKQSPEHKREEIRVTAR